MPDAQSQTDANIEGLLLSVTPRAIEVIPKDRLNVTDVSGEVTATVGAHPELHRDDGTPAQAGDVLSVQPNGQLQTRPAGTTGSFERAVVTAAGLVYRPIGPDGQTYLVPYVTDAPNK